MASRLKLVLGCADHDLNHALIDGAVPSNDLELEVVWDLADGERHRRMLRDGAFDACEFSFANYLVLWSAGAPFQGIRLPQSQVPPLLRVLQPAGGDSRAARPGRQAGGDAGLGEHGKPLGARHPAALLRRGPAPRHLVRATEGFAVQLPAGVTVEPLPEDGDLDRLSVAGDLDAVINPDVLPSVQRGAPEVHRLFEDYPGGRAGILRQDADFPISHLVVVKNEVVRAHPWVFR